MVNIAVAFLLILLTSIIYIVTFMYLFKPNIYMNTDINLIYIKDFLTDSECDHLINISTGKFNRSSVLINTSSSYEETRTSHSHYFIKSQDDIIKQIENKVSNYINKDVDNIEPLQIVKYEPGQEFKEHYDWFYEDFRKTINNDQRQFTIFVYLNDVADGGETVFPNLGIKVKPKKGDALFWQNCISPDDCSKLNLHQGTPPISGVKYGLNIWTRFNKNNWTN